MAQPTVQWSKCYGGIGTETVAGMVEAFDGGYVLAGTGDTCGVPNFWVVKINDTGKVIWSKCYGGSSADWASNIIRVRGETANDNGYLVSGAAFSNDGDVTNNHGAGDLWAVKIDLYGNLQWQKCYGGSGGEWARSATQTIDGDLVIAGYTYSTDGDVTGFHGDYDYWIIKVDDTTGSLIWQKTLGGSSFESANSVAATYDGGVIVTGGARSTDGDVTNPLGGQDIWVVKLDAGGNKQWDRSYGSVENENGLFVTQNTDTGYMVSGYPEYPQNMPNKLIKTDKSGNIKWTKEPFVDAVLQAANGDYIISGQTDSTNKALVLRMDSSGTDIWNKLVGGSNGGGFANSIFQTADGGYVVGGYTNSTDGDITDNHGDYDYWAFKLSPDPLSVSSIGTSNGNISVYPNPATDKLTIENAGVGTSLEVYDVVGKLMLRTKLESAKEQIDISHLSPGMYLLRFISKEGQQGNVKFVKK
jgi:hypothetical protein